MSEAETITIDEDEKNLRKWLKKHDIAQMPEIVQFGLSVWKAAVAHERERWGMDLI